MTICIKICGLTSPDMISAAVDAGANAIGFVFTESPRQVSVEHACGLARHLPAHIARVAVMRCPTPAQWQEVATGFCPDWLQTDAADFTQLVVDDAVVRLPVFRDSASLDARAVASVPCALFEGAVSGAGQRANWDRAAELACTTRLMLAGGLDAGNVVTAIRQVSPWGVDVSSGVETSRGVKDRDKITAFIQAVRETENVDAG